MAEIKFYENIENLLLQFADIKCFEEELHNEIEKIML